MSELELFLEWFIKHYSTEPTSNEYVMYYANAEGKKVSIADILQHYKTKER